MQSLIYQQNMCPRPAVLRSGEMLESSSSHKAHNEDQMTLHKPQKDEQSSDDHSTEPYGDDETTTSCSSKSNPFAADMPSDYAPGNYDVICGRSKYAYHHIGNRRFRLTIQMFAGGYKECTCRKDRTRMIFRIVELIRSCGGRFIKYSSPTRSWEDIGDQDARHKVGHALRDLMALQLSRIPLTRTAREELARKQQQQQAIKVLKESMQVDPVPLKKMVLDPVQTSAVRKPIYFPTGRL